MSFVSRSSLDLDFGVDEFEGMVAGGLAGALAGGVLLQLIDYFYIEWLGAAVGARGLWTGWVVMLALGLVLAVPFVVFVNGSVNTFVNQVMMLSRRSDLLQRILVPLLQKSAYGVTLYALGQAYGLLVGIAFVVGLPLWLAFIGTPVRLTPWFALAVVPWLVYGSTMGLVYGLRLSN